MVSPTRFRLAGAASVRCRKMRLTSPASDLKRGVRSMVSRTRRTSMMSTPIETIMDDSETENAGFYWRERDGVRALICAPLEQDGFTNAFSTRGGGVSPMPQDALNLAGFRSEARGALDGFAHAANFDDVNSDRNDHGRFRNRKRGLLLARTRRRACSDLRAAGTGWFHQRVFDSRGRRQSDAARCA